MDTNTEAAVAREVGIPALTFFSRIHYGGGAACATVQQAAMAVATGIADVVVCYRAFNERSGHRFGQVSSALAGAPTSSGVDASWSYPMGLGTPAAQVAMIARRYMHVYGATSEDFGRVAVADRKHAATNPNAFFFGKPITLEEHQASRLDRRAAAPARLLPGERRRAWRSWSRPPSGRATCPIRRPSSARPRRGAAPTSSR